MTRRGKTMRTAAQVAAIWLTTGSLVAALSLGACTGQATGARPAPAAPKPTAHRADQPKLPWLTKKGAQALLAKWYDLIQDTETHETTVGHLFAQAKQKGLRGIGTNDCTAAGRNWEIVEMPRSAAGATQTTRWPPSRVFVVRVAPFTELEAPLEIQREIARIAQPNPCLLQARYVRAKGYQVVGTELDVTDDAYRLDEAAMLRRGKCLLATVVWHTRKLTAYTVADHESMTIFRLWPGKVDRIETFLTSHDEQEVTNQGDDSDSDSEDDAPGDCGPDGNCDGSHEDAQDDEPPSAEGSAKWLHAGQTDFLVYRRSETGMGEKHKEIRVYRLTDRCTLKEMDAGPKLNRFRSLNPKIPAPRRD